MRKFSNKKIAAVAVAAVALTGTGVAYAYWTTTGSGSGSGSTAASNGTLALSGAAITGLTPGATDSIAVTATNGSTSTLAATALHITSVTSNKPACLELAEGAAPVFTAVPPAQQVVVEPNGGTASYGSVTVSLPNSASIDQESCKSATFTVNLSTVPA